MIGGSEASSSDDAKGIIALGIIIDTCYGVCAGMALMFALRGVWGKIFTTDAATQQMVFDCMPIMMVYVIVDATKCICLNVLRSTGRPNITGIVTTHVIIT